jgi:hypothetical protein
MLFPIDFLKDESRKNLLQLSFTIKFSVAINQLTVDG